MKPSKPVEYRVVSDDPLSKEDWIRLFQSKDRAIFEKYLSEKKLALILARGQAPSEEGEMRLGAIRLCDEILRDLRDLDMKLKASVRRQKEKQDEEAVDPSRRAE